jgi:hypothetical protein
MKEGTMNLEMMLGRKTCMNPQNSTQKARNVGRAKKKAPLYKRKCAKNSKQS